MTTIGPTISITGDVTSDEDLQIDGRVHGHIVVRDAALTITGTAHVEADVRGARIRVLGTVRGALTASERIVLAESADVAGSLSADHVVMSDGVRFQGQIDMNRRTIAAKLAHYKAQSA